MYAVVMLFRLCFKAKANQLLAERAGGGITEDSIW